MKIESEYIKNRLLESLRKEVSLLVDTLIARGLLVFPSPKPWFENGVMNENYKNGGDFSKIIMRAVELQLDRDIAALIEKFSFKFKEKSEEN